MWDGASSESGACEVGNLRCKEYIGWLLGENPSLTPALNQQSFLKRHIQQTQLLKEDYGFESHNAHRALGGMVYAIV